MISNMLTMHECFVLLTVMQKLLIVWTCYVLVNSLYTNNSIPSVTFVRLFKQLGWQLMALHKNWANTWKDFFIRTMEV